MNLRTRLQILQLETLDQPQPVSSSPVDGPDEESPATFDPLEWNTKLQEGQITFAEFLAKLDELDISYQVYPCANNKNKASIRYEYDGFPYVFNVDVNIIKGTGTNPSGGTSNDTAKTFTQAEVQASGLAQEAVAKYLTKDGDSYKFNEEAIKADFPDKQITTLEELKKAILAQITPEQMQAKIADITDKFVRGNMTLAQVKAALAEIGLEVIEEGDDDYYAGKYYITFIYEGKERTLICDKAAMNDGVDGANGKALDVWTASELSELGFTDDEMKTYFYGVAWGEPAPTHFTKNGEWPEGVNTPQELKLYLLAMSVTTDEYEWGTITQADVQASGLDAGAVAKYLSKQADGTYKLNLEAIKADFPDKQITTLEELKEAIDTLDMSSSGTIPVGETVNAPDSGNIERWFSVAMVRVAGFTQSEIDKYFIQIDDIRYQFNVDAIKADFPDEWELGLINLPPDLKVLIDLKSKEDKSTTFTEEDLAGLSADDIARYFTKQADGKYTFNTDNIKADFPDKEIETVAQLKEAIADRTAASKGYETPATTDTETTSQDDSTKKAAGELKSQIAKVASLIVSACQTGINFKETINVGYGTSFLSVDNYTFNDKNATTVFNTLLENLKKQIGADALETIGGEAMLKKLLQSAWVDASNNIADSKQTNVKTFVENILKNIDGILEKVSVSPEYLEYYTDDCYRDSDLTAQLPNYYSSSIKYQNAIVYNSGEVHLDDDASDKKFQETMNALLENIYNKYPNIDKDYLKQLFYQAQYNALVKATDTINNNGLKENMSNLIDNVLYHFDKLFKKDARLVTFDARKADPEARVATSSQTDERNNDIKDGAAGIMDSVLDVKDSIVSVCKEAIGYKSTIHTEFGVDSSGNIVFQESDTKKVYDTIFEKLKSKINRYAPDALAKLGGETVLKQLLQAAWITTYNDFNSSQFNNTTGFINKVMSNLEKMLNKLQTNPEYLEVFTKRVSYADTSVTNGVRHYNTNTTNGGDEVINYSGTPTTHADGTVHISKTVDDRDYQRTMSDLLNNLLNKYSSIDTDVVTSVFRKAQLQALKALQNNTFDCPYGTGNNDSRVEDRTRNWGGRNNRKNDGSKIHMDELVQMTLYYFDKLIYAELLK